MTSSSERTKKKASQAIYNELATNVRNNHNVAPVKKNGYTYNSLGITRYDSASTNKNQTAISNYASYAERMELKRGKQFSNSAINGTENLKYDIRAGNLIQVKYNTGGYNSPLVATGELDVSGGRIMRNDYVPYGNTIDYPGFITDYSNSIFKTSGIGSSENQQQKWVRNLTTQQHVGSHNWNKLNSEEQMSGFSLTSPILLWTAFDINITTQSDVSGYIFNGTHRKGELQNSINPTLYYDVHDHINFNVNVDTDIYISTDNVSTNTKENDGIISLNSKQNGTYYYNSAGTNNTLMTGKIIVGNGGLGQYNAIVYSETAVAAAAAAAAPTITDVTTIATPATNTTPSYTFASSESGRFTVTQSGSARALSDPTTASPYAIIATSNKTITFDTLSPGTYSNIIITVTDAAGNTGTHTIPQFIINTTDTTGPTITGGTPITTPATNTTPSYTFASSESGRFTVTQSGSARALSDPTTASPYAIIATSNKTITFDTLSPGTYSNIIITVTDAAGNPGTHTIPQFIINTIDTVMNNTAYVYIVSSSGNKYVFDTLDSNSTKSYVSTEVYTLTNDTYTFNNIASGHPMAILNNNQSGNISYAPVSNSDSPIIIKVSGGNTSATNGDYYTFTDVNNTQIYIGNGTFRFMRGKTYKFEATGISSSHPFKIWMSGSFQNNNNATNNGISGTGDYITITIPSNHSTTAGTLYYQCRVHSAMEKNLSLLHKSVTGTTADASYDFFYGDITVTVNSDFGNVSVYCYYHGYMGGENLLTYV